VSGRFTRVVARNTRASARYIYREGNFPFADGALIAGNAREHGVDIAINHIRPRSLTRRLLVDGTIGGSVVEFPPTADGRISEPSYRMVGQLGMSYMFMRSWQAGATYRRGVDFVPGFTEPVASEGATARVDGLLTRRLDMLIEAAYVKGESAVSRAQQTFDTYSGTARLRFALNRSVATYVEYIHYYYDFRGHPRLLPGVPPVLERDGVRAGLTLLVPVFGN
jgi:hypothetical protein